MDYVPPERHEIRALRDKYGHTRAEAAAMLGVSERTWLNWEYGNSKMRGLYYRVYEIVGAEHSKNAAG